MGLLKEIFLLYCKYAFRKGVGLSYVLKIQTNYKINLREMQCLCYSVKEKAFKNAKKI